jgi:putative transposase
MSLAFAEFGLHNVCGVSVCDDHTAVIEKARTRRLYCVRRLRLAKTEQLDTLARASGELYSRTVVCFWRTVRHKGVWLSRAALMRWHSSDALHAHSADAVIECFCASLKSWRRRRKADPTARPPRRRRRFFKVVWKSSGIRLRDGRLILSNGHGNEPLNIPWAWELPKFVEIGWDGQEYDLRAAYAVEADAEALGDLVAGVDLGEIHLAVAHDGETCFIANGRLLRSKRRYQNKLKAKLARKLAAKKKGSRRWKRAVRSRRSQLRKLDAQMKDILHKQTTRLVSTLRERGVQTVVVGDVRDIRQRLDHGSKANEKLHQMLLGATRWMLTYKSERRGMVVALQNEAYSSQTCPACGNRRKPRGRNYTCACGFCYHRDGVGSWNIRGAYLGSGPVVGAMASPIGLRYTSHVRCSSPVPRRERTPGS